MPKFTATMYLLKFLVKNKESCLEPAVKDYLQFTYVELVLRKVPPRQVGQIGAR